MVRGFLEFDKELSMQSILSLLVFAPGFFGAPTAERVTYETSDAVKIVADYYAPPASDPGKKAPVAILIHMYPVNRSSWLPLITPLHEAGFAILAYDIRGKGESNEPAFKNLRDLYGKRDPALFTEAWKDAAGGLKYLSKRPECDVSNVTVVGASIGAGIAVDFATHESRVKTLVLLSPYPEIMGLKTGEQLKQIALKVALFLISPDNEYDRIKDITVACNCAPKSEHYPGGAAQHGTNLMDEPTYGGQVVKSIVDFCKTALKTKTDEKKPPSDKKP